MMEFLSGKIGFTDDDSSSNHNLPISSHKRQPLMHTTTHRPLMKFVLLVIACLVSISFQTCENTDFLFHIHVCVTTSSSRSVKCCGNGGSGRLGYGGVENVGNATNEMGDSLPFVALGGDVADVVGGGKHSCASFTTSSSALKCWGENSSGQLGYEDSTDRGDASNEMGDYLPLVNLGSGVDISFIALTYYNTAIFIFLVSDI